jgi:hypothetical protein
VSDQYGRPDHAPATDDPLLMAARYNDAEIEDGITSADERTRGFEEFCKKHGLVFTTVVYLAEQRALSYAMQVTGDGEKRAEMQRTAEAKTFMPTEEQRVVIALVTPTYIDAILIGWRAHELAD